ncbi:AAA family ATPase [Microlunatus sp. GCM10028923]|uniref:AAA family ATPase n=1 Tax=Microlunatus sp. GCM10028923 TaxID=3273400 RepID=UPI003608B1F1
MSNGYEAVLINGTVGVGKTTVLDALGDHLAAEGIPGAAADLDELGRLWPNPPGDGFNLAFTLANLRDLSTNARAAGAEKLIMAGVVETLDQRRRFAEAVGGQLHLVRLRADPELIKERIRQRHEQDPEGRDWHLARVGELTEILDRAAVDDHVIDVTELAPEQTAKRIRTLVRL